MTYDHARPPQPAAVTLAVALVGAQVVIGCVMAGLAVVLDDEILRAAGGYAVSPDDTRVPPTYSPVAVVLAVVLSGLVLVLLAFFRGGHGWARHCLTVTCTIVGVAFVALLVSGTPAVLAAGIGVWLVVDVATLWALNRPEVAAYAAPRWAGSSVI